MLPVSICAPVDISEDLGIKLENVEISQLGQAKKIVVDKDSTTIIEGAGKKKAFKQGKKETTDKVKQFLCVWQREAGKELLSRLWKG